MAPSCRDATLVALALSFLPSLSVANIFFDTDDYLSRGVDEHSHQPGSASYHSTRRLRLIQTCQKYSDPLMAQFGEIGKWMKYPGGMVTERGDMSRAVFHSQPPVVACAPNFLGREALEELGQAAAKVLVPKKKPSKNTEKTEKKVKKKSKGMAALQGESPSMKKEGAAPVKQVSTKQLEFEYEGFDIAMFVMHPFLRLISSFKKIQSEGHKLVAQWEELQNTIPGADKPELNFQNFVKFVTQPENHLTGIEAELKDPKEEFRLSQRKPWQSYSRDCLVCSPDFYPTRIFKLDDENFAEDFESFVEDYGLEEVGEEAVEDFVTKMSALVPDGEDQVKPLMAQLDKSVFEGLVDYYSLDLEMFGYSAKDF